MIQKTTEINPTTDFRGIFCGRKGSGKSTAASSFPKPMKVYDLDRRIRSLQGVEDIDYIQFSSGAGFTEVDQELQNDINLINSGKYKYNTTLFSSLTSIQKLLMSDARKLIGDMRRLDPKKYAKSKTVLGTLDMSEMMHYNYISQAIDQLFYNALFYFPQNLIIEAHIVTKWDKDGNNIGKALLGTEKIAESIPTLFGELWEFSKEDSSIATLPPKYKVQFRGSLADTTIQNLKQNTEDITGKGRTFYQDVVVPMASFSTLNDKKAS
jgi:hypothetical protein